MLKLPKRDEVAKGDKWSVERIYSTDLDFEEALLNSKKTVENLSSLKSIEITNESLVEIINSMVTVGRDVNKLFIYAHMKHDENRGDSHYSGYFSQAQSLANQFGEMLSFFRPSLLALDEKKLNSILKNESLSFYKQYLEEIIRFKPHTLSEKEESLLASVTESLGGASNIFGFLNNADLKFKAIKTDDGEKFLSHGNYILYLEDDNREIRKQAFQNVMSAYKSFENTFSSIIDSHIKGERFFAKSRNFNSTIEASLFEDNVPLSVYNSLIEAINDSLPILHDYYQLRKKILGVDELHLYDVYKPLSFGSPKRYSYDEAIELVLEALKPLGENYIDTLKKGLESGWVDRYENEGKRSGAYSTGCYDTEPYILMNFNGSLNDVFTLAHEIGHSMHTHYSKTNQAPLYAEYKIFVAEVASIFNENLLKEYLLKNAKTDEERFIILNRYLENFRTTMFRQVMFAEFEKWIHAESENGTPLTPAVLEDGYYNLNKKYFGDSVVVDKEIEMEWARIPHFYYNFYVYKYAIGFATSAALAKKVLSKEEGALDRYIQFLSAGGSDYPISILQKAGVDLTTPEPVLNALSLFKKTLDEFKKLIK
ncbi:oligoendopeptidase F [bacterium]|nr:oligoendopeptidase F [bacterium]